MGSLRLFRKKGEKAGSVSQKSFAAELYRKNAIPVALGLSGMALGFFSLAYLMFIHSEPKFVPYIVTVDRQGSVLASDELHGSESIPENALAAFMCDFIEKLNSVCLDSDLQREFIRKVYSMVELESQGRRYLDSYYNSSDLFKAGRSIQQNVNIESVSRLSDSSFQVDYEVETIKFDETVSKHYKSILSYRIGNISYENVDELRLNPLSVLIYEIKNSRKIVKDSKNV